MKLSLPQKQNVHEKNALLFFGFPLLLNIALYCNVIFSSGQVDWSFSPRVLVQFALSTGLLTILYALVTTLFPKPWITASAAVSYTHLDVYKRQGNALAKKLEENGIGVIHDATQHDYPSYNGSYQRSAETIKKHLAQNPSIRIVLDVHRDGIQRTDTLIVKPTTVINGRKAAQLMIIAGCDDGTMNMPGWSENLRFAGRLVDAVETDSPTLMRPVMFCYRKYNQDLAPGLSLIHI